MSFCIACTLEVGERQHKIECDVCRGWQHRTCNTGVKITRYRKARRTKTKINFVCDPCAKRIPMIDEDPTDVEPSTSEQSVNSVQMGDFTLCLSTSTATETSVVTNEESMVDGEQSMFDMVHNESDVEMELPMLTSTVVEGPEVIHQADTSSVVEMEMPMPMLTSTVVEGPEVVQPDDSSLTMNLSFNISNRDIDDHEEIVERSMAEPPLSDTMVEEQPISFNWFENGSKRGGALLVSSDGYSYGVKKLLKSSVLWICSVRSKKLRCTATVSQAGETYIRGKNKHVHPADHSLLSKTRIRSQVIVSAKAHVFRSASELVEEAIHENVQPGVLGICKPDLVARAANRCRAKMRPQEPRDLEFTINREYLQCEDFLVDDLRVDTARHIIFATDEQLTLLKTAKRWFMDGTFRVLRSLQEVLVDPLVEGFVLDFEQGAWNGVRRVFPDVTIKGCVFHWTQAVWRRVQDLGLKPAYCQRSSTHNYVRHLLALPFLPAAHIPATFEELKRRATDGPLVDLVSYIERQWMNHSIFTVPSWSIFGHSVRTNNDVEGWHNRLNSRAGHVGLTFYRLVPALRKEAEMVQVQTHLINNNALTQGRRQVYKKVDERIEMLWNKYRVGELTTAQLLRGCARVYSPSTDGTDSMPATDE